MKYVSGPYTSGKLLADIVAIENALTNRFLTGGAITDTAEQASWNKRVLEASFGRNMVYFDDQGSPNILVKVDPMNLKELDPTWPNAPHPAFIIDGGVKTLWVGKYQAIRVGQSASYRVATLRGVDPQVYTNFDNALQYSRNSGLHLATWATFAYLALRAKQQGFMPRGNNLYGKDHTVQSEVGTPSYTYQSSGTDYTGRVYTGSGPISWSDDGSPFGIYDLNGNVWEWAAGYRTVDGEIQIIPAGDAALSNTDMGVNSTAWKAILQDGSLVAPGTADTLKWDATGVNGAGKGKLNTIITSRSTGSEYTSNLFKDLEAAVTVPELLKQLAIYPVDANIPYGGFYMRNIGERLPSRGGSWDFGSSAGVFAVYGHFGRTSSVFIIGFRSALYL